jgi:hypothetical protein
MNQTFFPRARFFLAPDHGGDAIQGGGHPADSPVPENEMIDDGMGFPTPQRGKKPGTGDPGEPGSRTNPVHGEPQPEDDRPVGRPTGEGSGSGS